MKAALLVARLAKKGEAEKLQRMLEGRERSSGMRGGPLKKRISPLQFAVGR